MQPPSRRTFLALGLLLTGGALTACTGTQHQDPGSPAGDHSRPDPDEPVRRRALDATDTLLAAYDALLPQAPQLQPLREEVARHRAALDTATPAPAPATGAGSGTPGATRSAATTSATAGATTSATAAAPTTAALASLERQTAQTRLADLGAASPALARLLASVSAAGVLHAVALGDAAPAAAAAPAPSAPVSASTSAPASTSGSGPAVAGGPAAPFQDALGAEHAAVYGYGVVGARLADDGQRTAARTALAAHQARRDAWQRLLAGTGATPDPAAAGYQLPFPVTDAASAGRLAAHLETRLTAVYADLVAAVPAPQRPPAADALRESALRAHQWGAVPAAFPGIGDTPTGTSTPAP
ncbi:ferritin-like domain-containing protein [Kitasatospora purpeofusca]|uniref:ferritin-like domain-containing protein n=1 Tax=Kitasatospora purpeofusca TaxID=67352 RepID=UPI002A5A4019|nr:ferritin-like domain-containing protein [Kitasatospora purpeofusca]MDY0814274.1 ferritin-like domain-containing protein [Kitasatospora purpeofusca]